MQLPTSTRLVLIRHAESAGNAEQVMQGGAEYPLSDLGLAQARAVRHVVASWRPDVVASSDLSRAIDTAILAAGRVDVVEPRIRERGAGAWEGRPRSDLEAHHPGALDSDALRPDGFEAADVVISRMRTACEELLHRDGLVVAFSHGAVMRLLAAEIGDDASRFGHLESLCLGDELSVRGRLRLLAS